MLLSYADSTIEDPHVINGEATPPVGVVVVIFNRRCSESVSFVKMLQISLPVLLLIDNSTDTEIIEYNRQYCLQQKCEYYFMGENKGLSKAYNAGIERIGNRTDYLMILDDDTIVPDDVFSQLAKGIIENPTADIYVPYVTDQKALLSPSRRMSSLFFRLHTRPNTFSSNMSAINSGLVIHLRPETNKGPHFDEKQFLDCIDHLFIFQQIKSGAEIRLYPAEFRQTFFDRTAANLEGQKEKTYIRFERFAKDYRYFCRTCSLNRWISELYLLFRAIKLNLRYRTTLFFIPLHKT